MFNQFIRMNKRDSTKKEALSIRSVLRQQPVLVKRNPNQNQIQSQLKTIQMDTHTGYLNLLQDFVFTTQDVIDSLQAPQTTDWINRDVTYTIAFTYTGFFSNRLYIILAPWNDGSSNHTYDIGNTITQIEPIIKKFVDKTNDTSIDKGDPLQPSQEGNESYTINVFSNDAILEFLDTIDTNKFLKELSIYNKTYKALNGISLKRFYIPTKQSSL